MAGWWLLFNVEGRTYLIKYNRFKHGLNLWNAKPNHVKMRVIVDDILPIAWAMRKSKSSVKVITNKIPISNNYMYLACLYCTGLDLIAFGWVNIIHKNNSKKEHRHSSNIAETDVGTVSPPLTVLKGIYELTLDFCVLVSDSKFVSVVQHPSQPLLHQ